MSAGLIRKELRGQWPFLFLGLALLALEIIEILREQWDLRPLSITFHNLDQFLAAQFVIAFAVGTGLLMREIDDGTLTFLDGLPLTRAHIFAAKLTAACMVLLVYPLGFLGLLSVLHLMGRESLDHALQPTLIATQAALAVLLTCAGVACGLLLGFLRSLSWMSLALMAIAIKVLSMKWPRFSALNPAGALTIHPVGAHAHLSMEGVAVQSAALLIFGLPAYWLFNMSGAGRRRQFQLQLSRPLISALVTVATAAALLGAVFVYTKSAVERQPRQSATGNVDSAQFTPTAAGHAQTLHFTFSYPAQQSEQVQVLLQHADEIFANVAKQLDIGGGPAIDVDLSGSEDNTEGTAFFDRIRMFANGTDPLAVLAHETTHVFADRLAGGDRERELGKMEAFNEGLAHWVEKKLSTGSGVSDVDKLQAAIVSRRHMVSARQLTDMDAVAREVDLNLQYPLGAALIDVLVKRNGADAPKRILLTIGRPDFPRDLKGVELWQAAFQISGIDLAVVFEDYTRRLKGWEDENSALIDDLPRPRGSLVRTPDFVGVSLRTDGPLDEDSRLVVRFRPQDDSPLREYATLYPQKRIAWRSIKAIANQKVCFQPGLRTHGIVVYEAWTCLSLDSAAEYKRPEQAGSKPTNPHGA
jgi:ABC-type transport system involved in multi-copper enzyme maturation permease subunit